jgi:O-antigen/teichoic acid export membrane protein
MLKTNHHQQEATVNPQQSWGIPVSRSLSAFVNSLLANSLLRNSFFIMATTILTSGLGYFYWVLVARFWSPVDLGLASSLFGLLALAGNLTNFGLGTVLVQVLPASRSAQEWSAVLNAALIIGFVSGLGGGGLLAFFLPIVVSAAIGSSTLWSYQLVCLLAVPLLNIVTILDAVYTAQRANGNLLVRNLVFALLKLILLAVMIPLGLGLGAEKITGTWLVALLLVSWFGYRLIKHLKPDYPGLDFRQTGKYMYRLVKPSIWHYLTNLGAMLPTYLLPSLIALKLSAAHSGFFYTTWMIGGLFFMIAPAIATSLSAEGSHSQMLLRYKTQQSIFYLLIILPPVILFFWVGGRYLLGIFGSEYTYKSETLFYILLLSTIPDAITTLYVSLMRVKNLLYCAAGINLFMSLSCLILTWYFLPILDITGVGVAWLISQTLGCLVIGIHWILYLGAKRS